MLDLYLYLFLIKSYYRQTHFIIQIVLLATIAGLFLDPRYAPYTYEYCILVINTSIILLSFITGQQLIDGTYNRSLLLLLNRVSRRSLYLALLFSITSISFLFFISLMIYVLLFSGAPAREILSILLPGLMIILLTVVVTALFSRYSLSFSVPIPSLLILALGFMPKWYEDLPLRNLFQYVAFFLPPLERVTTLLQNKEFFLRHILFCLLYCLILVLWGLNFFGKKNLTDLKS